MGKNKYSPVYQSYSRSSSTKLKITFLHEKHGFFDLEFDSFDTISKARHRICTTYPDIEYKDIAIIYNGEIQKDEKKLSEFYGYDYLVCYTPISNISFLSQTDPEFKSGTQSKDFIIAELQKMEIPPEKSKMLADQYDTLEEAAAAYYEYFAK